MVSEGDCAKRLKGRSAEARRGATADGLFITSPSYCGNLGLTIWKTLTYRRTFGGVLSLAIIPSSDGLPNGGLSSLPSRELRIPRRVGWLGLCDRRRHLHVTGESGHGRAARIPARA